MPSCAPAKSPSEPNTTFSTSGGPGSDEKTMSHCSATDLGVSAHSAPWSRCRWAASRRTSFTTSLYCDFCRLAAIWAPMVPSPMNPIFMISPLRLCLGLVLGLELLHRRADRGDRRGRAGIDADMQEYLLQLLARQPVVQAHADVRLQLLAAVSTEMVMMLRVARSRPGRAHTAAKQCSNRNCLRSRVISCWAAWSSIACAA